MRKNNRSRKTGWLVGGTLSLMAAVAAPVYAQGAGNGTGGGNGMGGGGGGNGTGTYTVQLSPGVSLRSITTYPDGTVRAQRNGGAVPRFDARELKHGPAFPGTR